MDQSVAAKPFMDISKQVLAKDIDCTLMPQKRHRWVLEVFAVKKWLVGKWGEKFMELEPSIE